MLLQTLHMLASSPKLKAVTMRLMTALWKRQVSNKMTGIPVIFFHVNVFKKILFDHFVPGSPKDRVYPELQRLLGQQDTRLVVGKDTQWEQTVARAACLRDICRERCDI